MVANIYLSVTRAVDIPHQETYHRPIHTWMLSIEPHHTHFAGVGRKDPEPIHYSASRNEETGVYTIKTHQAESEPLIIGNILVVESTHASPEDIHKLLEELLGPGSQTKSKDDGGGNDDEPEHWIRRALHAMQKRNIAQHFDIEELFIFARSYEARRMEDEAPALVAFPKIHKDHEQKASKHKFWITHPMAARTKTNDRGEASTYGGLM